MRWLIPILVLTLAGHALAQDGWRLETANAQWDPRTEHNAVTFNNEIWVLQGSAGTTSFYTADAWSSSDGVNWSQRVDPLPWISALGTKDVEFNGVVWLLGGKYGGPLTSQVWRSSDGMNWTQEPDAPWTGRTGFGAFAFNGKMWIVGGMAEQYPFRFRVNDVWSTADGVNWTQEVAAAAWSPRNAHTAAAFNNRMWILGGADAQGVKNDVWSSVDGVNWVQETANAPWESRALHATVVYRDRLWVIGGVWSDGWTNALYRDVWSSADGVNWVEETNGAPWGEGERVGYAVTVANDRIWLMGGTNSAGPMNDVWSYGLHIVNDGLPDAVVGESYHADFEAREGDGPFVWSLSGGSLPPGLTLDTLTTAATTEITGVPQNEGEYTFTVQLEDADGNVIEQDYTLTVHPPPPVGGDSGGSSGCTARSAGPARPGGLPWLILTTAATLAAILRRRVMA